MSLHWLDSCNWIGLQPEMLLGLLAVQDEFEKIGQDTLVTSATDGVHPLGKVHICGYALDFRTHALQDNQMKQNLRASISSRLGPQFDVVLEGLGTQNEHIHAEFDPKTR